MSSSISSAELVPNPVSFSTASVSASASAVDPSSTSTSVTISYYTAEDWENFHYQPDAKLCVRCQTFLASYEDFITLFDKSRPSPTKAQLAPFSFKAIVQVLLKSVKSGCPLCRIILNGIKGDSYCENNREVDESDEVFEVFMFKYYSPLWGLAFRGLEVDSNDSEKYFCTIGPSDKWDPQNPPAPLLRGRTTGSRHALQKVQSWYKACKETHQNCQENVPRVLPTRLRHYRDGNLRLCLSKSLCNSTRYATLSHCWGKLKMFTLRTDNLEDFYTYIPIDKLCKTFQDALHVTQELGLEYLWIDSLCVVQNDMSDWQRESVLMSSVYGCSDITIAAASSLNGSQGCFHERQLPIQRTLQIHINHHQHSQTFTIKPSQPSEWHPQISEFPLMKRGWVYQERRLSPRKVLFGRDLLIWECSSWNGQEWWGKQEYRTGNAEDITPERLAPKDIMFWDSVVAAYSACNLTFPEDKLVAISGIAKRRQEETLSEYVAGMWKEDLEHQLCWKTIYRCRKDKPAIYQAPSWSWAATASEVEPASYYSYFRTSGRGKITLPDYSKSCLSIKVLSTDITLSSPDPMGAVLRGTLNIQCTILLGGVGGSTPSSEGAHWSRLKLAVRIAGEIISCFVTYDFLSYNFRQSSPYYFLPIRHHSETIQGIILQPTHHAIGEYQRMGIFEAKQIPPNPRGTEIKNSKKIADCHRLLLEPQNFVYSKQDRELLFASSESETGPHIITLV